MNVKLRPEKYLRYLYLPNLFGTTRTKEILSVNPTLITEREDATSTIITVYDYNADSVVDKRLDMRTGLGGFAEALRRHVASTHRLTLHVEVHTKRAPQPVRPRPPVENVFA